MPRVTRASKRNAPTSDDEKSSPKPTKKNKKETSAAKINTKSPKPNAEPLKSPSRSSRRHLPTASASPKVEDTTAEKPSPATKRSLSRIKNKNSSPDSSLDASAATPSPPKGKKSKLDAKVPEDVQTSKKGSARKSNQKVIVTDKIERSPTVAAARKNSPAKPVKNSPKQRNVKLEKKQVPSMDKKTGKAGKARLKRGREKSSSMSEDDQVSDLPIKKHKVIDVKPRIVIIRDPLPRQLSKEELYDQYIKSLCKKLDNYDLSDPTEAKNMFCDWPTEDLLASKNNGEISLSNRIWFSDSSVSNSSNSALCNGNGQSKSSLVDKNRNNDELDVVSYNIGHLSSGKDVERMLNELNEINSDIYCFQDVKSHVIPQLIEVINNVGCSYSKSTHGSLIAYNRNKFEKLEFHELNVFEAAMNVVNTSAYPLAWRESIQSAIKEWDTVCSRYLTLCVLRHRTSNIILLVATQSKEISSSCKNMSMRPDIMALNVAGVMWCISRLWQEIEEKYKDSLMNTNGHSRNGDNITKFMDQCRWIFCGPLNASQDSPIYQLCKDGYPNDETLNRLRCVLTVKLPQHPPLTHPPIDPEDSSKDNSYIEDSDDKASIKKKALVDLIWNAFQHPCTDVISCNQAVIGREPPFTRYVPEALTAQSKSSFESKLKCLDYIWCSGATLKPKAVLLPPCRALMSDVVRKHNSNSLASSLCTSIPLVARMNLVVSQVQY